MLFLFDLFRYITAVFGYWEVYVTGGLITAIITVFERWRGKNLSWRAYAQLIAAFLVIAMFLVWRDERQASQSFAKEKEALATTNTTLEALIKERDKSIEELKLKIQELSYAGEKPKGIEERNRNRTIREELGRFLPEGEALRRKCLTNVSFPQLKREVAEWERRVEQYLLAHLDSSYAARFNSPPPDRGAYPAEIQNIEVMGLWGRISMQMEVLSRFMEELKD